MKKYFCLIILLTLVSASKLSAKQDTLSVAFWNVENLYDTINDPQKNDEEFLPNGAQAWTSERFQLKIKHLAEVIQSMNKGRGPDILGMAEVENKFVVEQLTAHLLNKDKYSIAHIDSPDERGIDVVLIYRNDKFTLLKCDGLKVELPSRSPTRLILNVLLKTKSKDTLCVFVNHWPSRRGGEAESEQNRIAAATVLRTNVDAYMKSHPAGKILIMGDFNDEPTNNSLVKTLQADSTACEAVVNNAAIYNLAYSKKKTGEGSFKFQQNWNMLDQMMISRDLLMNPKMHYLCNSFQVYKYPAMVEHSAKYEGSPFPTFGGKNYLGGYSDHFPVMTKFVIIKK